MCYIFIVLNQKGSYEKGGSQICGQAFQSEHGKMMP
jgi:hypothetical protein